MSRATFGWNPAYVAFVAKHPKYTPTRDHDPYVSWFDKQKRVYEKTVSDHTPANWKAFFLSKLTDDEIAAAIARAEALPMNSVADEPAPA